MRGSGRRRSGSGGWRTRSVWICGWLVCSALLCAVHVEGAGETVGCRPRAAGELEGAVRNLLQQEEQVRQRNTGRHALSPVHTRRHQRPHTRVCVRACVSCPCLACRADHAGSALRAAWVTAQAGLPPGGLELLRKGAKKLSKLRKKKGDTDLLSFIVGGSRQYQRQLVDALSSALFVPVSQSVRPSVRRPACLPACLLACLPACLPACVPAVDSPMRMSVALRRRRSRTGRRRWPMGSQAPRAVCGTEGRHTAPTASRLWSWMKRSSSMLSAMASRSS